jgi:hypothetical protein
MILGHCGRVLPCVDIMLRFDIDRLMAGWRLVNISMYMWAVIGDLAAVE